MRFSTFSLASLCLLQAGTAWAQESTTGSEAVASSTQSSGGSTTTATPTSNSTTDVVPGPGEVVIASVDGKLRMIPFELTVLSDEYLTLIFDTATNVTQSSFQQVCNASDEKGALSAGQQEVGARYRWKIPFDSLQTYFAGSPDDCEQGMFGFVNAGKNDTGNFKELMDERVKSDTSFATLYNETKEICGDNSEAWSYGDRISTVLVPDWAKSYAAENILFTRQFYARHPTALTTSTSASSPPASTSSDKGSGSSPLQVFQPALLGLGLTVTLLVGFA
ncbi:uncharacterized protein JCM6883_003777 [Sporobolomyces salmoneus]|uniref:uncharacterized protein n=1 Tax=Sporobolomyces salmoneus TaxID=183962 RepID=UPI00316FB676